MPTSRTRPTAAGTSCAGPTPPTAAAIHRHHPARGQTDHRRPEPRRQDRAGRSRRGAAGPAEPHRRARVVDPHRPAPSGPRRRTGPRRRPRPAPGRPASQRRRVRAVPGAARRSRPRPGPPRRRARRRPGPEHGRGGRGLGPARPPDAAGKLSVHTHPGLAEPRTKEEWRAYLDDVPPERPAVPSYDEYLALPDLLDEVVDDVPVVAGESGDEARDVVLSLHRQR